MTPEDEEFEAIMKRQLAEQEAKKPAKREWVGLSVNEARAFYEKYTDREELIYAIDKFLEEKNT